jgi:ABC-type sugar transport system permease subunit
VAKWVGFDNYKVLLSYDAFWTMLGNSAFYWVAHAAPMLFSALILAVIAHKKVVRWSAGFQSVVFLPQLRATVAAAMVFQNLFGESYGAVNALLGVAIPWLTDPFIAKCTVVIVLIWRNTGYWFVIFLAALTSIPPEMDEAAKIDGANARQRFWYVTMPMLRPTLLFAVLVDAIVTLRLFAEPNVLLGQFGTLAPASMAPVLNLIVEQIKGGQFGLASAAGWLLFLVIAGVSFMIARVLREKEYRA